MGDGEHRDRMCLLVQRVDHAIGTSTGCPAAIQLEAQRLTETFRVARDRRQQLDYRRRVELGKPTQLASRLPNSAFSSSSETPSSPLSNSASLSRICRISSGSERTASAMELGGFDPPTSWVR